MAQFSDSVGSGSVTASLFSMTDLDRNEATPHTEDTSGSLKTFENRTGGTKSDIDKSSEGVSDTCSVTSTGECRQRVDYSTHDTKTGGEERASSKSMFTPLESNDAPKKKSKIKRKSNPDAKMRSGAPTAPVPNPPTDDANENANRYSPVEPRTTNQNADDAERSGGDEKTVEMYTCATNASVQNSVNNGFWRVCQLGLVIILGVVALFYVMHQRTRVYMARLMQELSDRNTINMSEFDLGPLKAICEQSARPVLVNAASSVSSV